MIGKNVVIASVFIIIVVLGTAFVYIATTHADNGVENTYQITYELGGGVNSEDNPEKYVSGRTYVLSNAAHTDHFFAGWYVDKDLTKRCDSITSGMSGDLVLYAKWTDNHEGQGLVLSISGTNVGGLFFKHLITGEATYKYLYYDETNDRYYMNSSLTMYFNGSQNQMRTSETQYWSDEENDVTWTKDGTKVIDTVNGEKECTVLIGKNSKSLSVETQYIGDGWIPYYITYDLSNTVSDMHLEYKYVKTITFDTKKDYNVTAYSDYGISVSGSGTYHIGESATLTASVSKGVNFKGWYDSNGNILSTSKTYSFDVIGSDVTVYALNDDDSDYTYVNNVGVTLLSDVTLTSAKWTIYSIDHKSSVGTVDGVSPTFTFADPGMYYIYIEGSNGDEKYSIRYDVLVNGDVSRSFSWKSGGETYSYSLDINYTDVKYYRNHYSLEQRGQDLPTHARDVTFVTYKDKYIVEIANDFKSRTSGMSDVEVSNFVLAFTQYIEYQEDITHMGSEEYWKFPLETLFDQGGDCEDTSILYCAIMKAMGYDVVLLIFPLHMAGAVSISGCTGSGYSVGGKVYYYCETTVVDYDTGEIPQNYRGYSATIIRL